MLEPFDPTSSEVEEWLAEGGHPVENSEDTHDDEEARQPNTRKVPIQPSQEEVDKHMVTHLPFRDWCPHCVRGKSGSKPHKASHGTHEIPTVAIDYMFMHSQQNEQEETGMPILVTRDLPSCSNGTGMISASVLIQKGVCP